MHCAAQSKCCVKTTLVALVLHDATVFSFPAVAPSICSLRIWKVFFVRYVFVFIDFFLSVNSSLAAVQLVGAPV